MFDIDGLLVMAPGIGIKQLFAKFVKAYCVTRSDVQSKDSTDPASDPSHDQAKLVFCLNASNQETSIRRALLVDGVPYAKLPVNIYSKVSQASRSAMYARGGCYFTTARVMIVDLLTERVDAKNICGFLVFDSDRVSEMSMEAFILKLFKRNNPQGFVKVMGIISSLF